MLARGLVLFALLGMFCAVTMSNAEDTKKAASKAESKDAKKVLRHVVLFKFKPGTSEEQIKEVTDAFSALPKKIDAIEDFEWGLDNSPEGKAAGFTHCFLVTFRDEKGRDEYLPHPEHKKFVGIVGPVLEDALVVDYWTKE